MSDRKRLKRLALALVTLTMVGGWAGPAFAVDGVILIDQPREMAGSVTPVSYTHLTLPTNREV